MENVFIVTGQKRFSLLGLVSNAYNNRPQTCPIWDNIFVERPTKIDRCP